MIQLEFGVQGELTLGSILRLHALRQPDAVAILGEDFPQLRYCDLWDQVELMGRHLHQGGITPAARVGIAMPNGPEMAVAVLATTTYATAVPLSMAFQYQECCHYLEGTRSQALIVQIGDSGPARAVALDLGLPVFEMDLGNPDSGSRLLSIHGKQSEDVARSIPTTSDAHDIALILHTSGTTASPKRVPLNQGVLLASARNIARHLQLTPADRCLNVMALFHSHGLVGALLSSIVSGGSVVCSRRFDQNRFFDLVAEFQPTWYTATPTIHQAVLENGDAYQRVAPGHRFRFVRSSSAPLSPLVGKRLQDLMSAPVIESYGMTEWSQMTSTPLNGPFKSGSVGVSSGVEVAVCDADGRVVTVGEGDVLVRGSVLTNGYEGDSDASRNAFRDGWFVTGDQGRIDTDGYLYLSGRTKEVINRGGEKVSPREIDEALLEHPDVVEATAFSAPHPSLGEDVIAAVVLRKGAFLQEETLRAFLFERLANFKIPSNILFLAEIPKGPAGKVQRLGLYEKLGSRIAQPFVAPRNRVEELIESGFREVLDCGPIGIDDNFFNLGGDSLAAVSLFSKLDEVLGRDLPISVLLRASTIRQLAQFYAEVEVKPASCAMVPISVNGDLPPVFAMPGIYGNVLCFTSMARELGDRQPLYGLQSVGLDGMEVPIDTMVGIAERNLSEVRKIQPHGPYFLLGACFGASVAFEMARQLISSGERVAYCALIDPSLRGGSLREGGSASAPGLVSRSAKLGAFVASRLRLYREEMRGLGLLGRLRFVRSKTLSLSRSAMNQNLMRNASREISQQKVYEANLNALRRYKPHPLATRSMILDIYQTQRRLAEELSPHRTDWRHMAETVTSFPMPGKDSGDMLRGENVKALASILAARLALARQQVIPMESTAMA